jgi:hypothetical protein
MRRAAPEPEMCIDRPGRDLGSVSAVMAVGPLDRSKHQLIRNHNVTALLIGSSCRLEAPERASSETNTPPSIDRVFYAPGVHAHGATALGGPTRAGANLYVWSARV